MGTFIKIAISFLQVQLEIKKNSLLQMPKNTNISQSKDNNINNNKWQQ